MRKAVVRDADQMHHRGRPGNWARAGKDFDAWLAGYAEQIRQEERARSPLPTEDELAVAILKPASTPNVAYEGGWHHEAARNVAALYGQRPGPVDIAELPVGSVIEVVFTDSVGHARQPEPLMHGGDGWFVSKSGTRFRLDDAQGVTGVSVRFVSGGPR